MRLNREKAEQNPRIVTKKKSNHLKTSSMDNITTTTRTKNNYLNKILEKNLGNSKIADNMPNFQSSIQSIFSNYEKRQKAKNYVMNLRNKTNLQSPYKIEDDYISKSKNQDFQSSNYGGFYDNTLRKT